MLRTWIATWVSFSALLGVTWVFGILYIQVSPAFAYPFVILNGLQVDKLIKFAVQPVDLCKIVFHFQGVLIFLSRIVFNKQARDALGLYIKQKRLLYQFDGILMVCSFYYIFLEICQNNSLLESKGVS
jgi:hypothetical protein